MQATKIEWCDATWNPVTGCLHECKYCYAKKIAERFGGCYSSEEPNKKVYNVLHDLEKPRQIYGNRIRQAPFPYKFEPTLHRYRLSEPQKKKKPQNIFVCSMADLFGEWVPDEWIEAVFEACKKAPWHRYIFLTKNPERYAKLPEKVFRMAHLQDDQELWMGCTINNRHNMADAIEMRASMRCFLSIEPLQTEVSDIFDNLLDAERYIKWVIIGAETGNRKGKIIPKREWIENILRECEYNDIPVFMKNSLAKIWQGELAREFGKLPQQFPWEAK